MLLIASSFVSNFRCECAAFQDEGYRFEMKLCLPSLVRVRKIESKPIVVLSHCIGTEARIPEVLLKVVH